MSNPEVKKKLNLPIFIILIILANNLFAQTETFDFSTATVNSGVVSQTVAGVTLAVSNSDNAVQWLSRSAVSTTNVSPITLTFSEPVDIISIHCFEYSSEEGTNWTFYANDGSDDITLVPHTGKDVSLNFTGVREIDIYPDIPAELSIDNVIIAIPTTTITSSTYDIGTGVLDVTGENFEANAGVSNDVDVSDLTLTGEGNETYTLTSGDVEITNATSFSVPLNATDQEAVKMMFNKNGTASTVGTNYNLAAADDFITNVTAGDISDATNSVTVSGVTNPTITSAEYNYNTNTFVVTGENFVRYSGAFNDVDLSSFTITGEGGSTYTLTNSSDVEITTSTEFSFVLSNTDVVAVEHLLNKDGTQADDGTTSFNLAAADNWMLGTDAAANIADATNGITVSNYAAPVITSIDYDYSTNQFSVTGTNFVSNPGATNDVDLSDITITGEGSIIYTLTTTSEIEITSPTQFSFTLSGLDIPEVEFLLNKDGTTSTTAGTTYNFATFDNWIQGAAPNLNTSINTQGITVSNFASPAITSSTYNYDTNVLTVTGTNFVKAMGANNDIVVSLLTITGEGGATYTITSTNDVEITSSTEFSITLSDADLINVEALLDKDGTNSATNTLYNLAAADNWMAGSPAGNNIADATSGITVNSFANPSITSTTYDAATGVLTATGTNFVVNSGADNDIDASLFTFTGEGSGTYTLSGTPDVEITSATEFSLTLDATDKLNVNGLANKNGTNSADNTNYNLAAADNWMTGSPAGNTITDGTSGVDVSNIPLPTITSATYNFDTNLLVVTGTDFVGSSGVTNDVDISLLTLTGEGGSSYTITSTNDVEISSSTTFSITLSGTDLTSIEALLNKDGTSSNDNTTYNLAAADNWMAGTDPAENIADAPNAVTVSNYAVPEITSAAFNFNTNQIVLTGTNFVSNSGATNDIDVSLLTFTGGNNSTYTLTNTLDVEVTSSTVATITLSADDALNIRGLLNKDGTVSSTPTTYNVAAADNWLPGSPESINTEDLTGNGITVTNVQVPTLTNATYDSDTGTFVVTGTNLFKNPGAANDIDISTITLVGGSNETYTITSATDVEITSGTEFTFTVSGTDITNLYNILDQVGTTSSSTTTYDIEVADNWLTAADAAFNIADSGPNALTVIISPKITSATYNASTGVLAVSGSDIQANGGLDIDASKFTFTGEGGTTYTLTNTADVDRTDIASFTLTLSATDKNAVNMILNKEGTSPTSGTTYNIAAADDWCTNVTAGNTEDLTGNAITVSNVPLPSITSATYNVLTGTFVVTGTDFVKKDGTGNDIDVSKFTITGAENYTLTNTADVEISTNTEFTIVLSAEDKEEINQIINKDGTISTLGMTYNFAAAEDWNTGADPAVVIADKVGNGITVINVQVPAITNSTYNWSGGILKVTGTGFTKLVVASNDIDASRFTFTGEAGGTYTLIGTPDVDITSSTEFTLTLDATDKSEVNSLINSEGTESSDNTTYNLAAAEDWNTGADGAVVIADKVGNGITASNFATNPTTTNKTITINEDGTYQFSTNDFAFNDPDGDSFAGIVLTSIDTTGTLLFNGSDAETGVDYADVSSLSFIPNPNESGIGYSSFSFKVKDNNNNGSNIAAIKINVSEVNDAPIISNLGGDSSSVKVGGSTISIDQGGDVSISNVESDTLKNGSMSISQISGSANGSFQLSGAVISNGQDVVIGGVTIGTVSSDGQSGNGLGFTFNENASTSLVASLIQSISYSAPSGLDDRKFSVTLNDGEGTSNGGVAIATANITITIVAQPSQILVMQGTDILENDSTFIFENRSLNSDTSVSFTINNNGLGSLSVTLPLSVSGESSSEYSISQQPDTNITPGASSSFTVNFKPVSSGDKLASIAITNNDSTNNPYVINLKGSGNTPPTGKDSEVTTNEDETFTFSASDFNYSDVNGDAFSGIKITSSVTAGQLLYDGKKEGLSGDMLDPSKLVFIPESNTNGSPYTQFSYKLMDSKNSYSTSSYTMTINVDPVDDAPFIVINAGILVDEGGTLNISDNNLLAKDNDEDSDVILYKITEAPNNGIIAVGTNNNSKTVFSQHDVSTGKVRYIHNGSETTNDSFKFTIEDNQGNSSGEETFSISVSSVNDAPTIAAIPNLEMNEDESYSLSQTAFYQYISDSENSDSTLDLSFIAGDKLSISKDNNSNWVIIPDENYNGASWITLLVSDGTDTTSSKIVVDVKSKNDIPVISEIPSIDILEDEQYNIEKTVLYGYISDLDHPDSLLNISFIAGEHLEVNKTDASNWLMTPEENYFGNSSLTLLVNDGIDTASINITVNIEEVNDPPVVEEVPDSIEVTNDGDTNFTLDFDDIESDNDSLKVEYTCTEGITVNYDSLSHTFTVAGNEGFVGESILTIKITDSDGAVTTITIPIAVNNRITGITQLDGGIPLVYSLDQNFPNPFNPTTKIRFGLPEISEVSLKIYDILGKEVATLVNASLSAGYYEYYWNASHNASGIYFYLIDVNSGKGFRKVKKMILVK